MARKVDYPTDFLSFVNASPSPFHAVHQAKSRLLASGFTELSERSRWPSEWTPGAKYFIQRNQSALVAFVVGGRFRPGNGMSIVGAHTDSPCLKLKPVSRKENAGYLQVGVQTYGGGLWHTWFDRDLGVAGRVMVEQNGTIENNPILRVPTLAIHLDRSVNEKFQFNNETHLAPMLATVVKAELNGFKKDDKKGAHHAALIQALAKEMKVDTESIADFELCLFDTQPSVLGGLYEEFIFSPRLDNLMMSYCSIQALLESLPTVDQDENIRMVALFDNEEVGSETAHGAGSNFLEAIMRRISMTGGHSSAFDECAAKSLLVSADMAHAIHPNYPEKHESNHQPKFHGGLVIKHNANQRYATTSVTSTILKAIAKRVGVPVQEFVVRNDSPCGSTIGPMLSAKLGMRTIDVGSPQLSMHSIREVAATDDVEISVKIFTEFFSTFAELDKTVRV